MGESTDDSNLSDETIEAQERGVDTSKSLGFASDQARDDSFSLFRSKSN